MKVDGRQSRPIGPQYFGRHRFRRQTGTRPLIRQIYVATEGVVTEPEYLDKLRPYVKPDCRLTVIRRPRREVGYSAPPLIRQKMEQYRRTRNIRLAAEDEQWLLFDIDAWTPEQFADCRRWARSRPGNYLGVSHPSFEYWLLLHFEEPERELTPMQLDIELRRYLPAYRKHLPQGDLSADRIRLACVRARERHILDTVGEAGFRRRRKNRDGLTPDELEADLAAGKPGTDLRALADVSIPEKNGSTVYRLIEHLLGNRLLARRYRLEDHPATEDGADT